MNVQKHICRDKIENSCIGYSGYKNLKICSDSLRNAVATLFIKRPNTPAKTGGQTGGQTSGQTSGQTTIEQVYSLIKNTPTITRAQLMELTGKSSNTIQKCILKLKQDNRIKRIGSPTFGGYWQIID